MSNPKPITMLCITSEFKGTTFIEEAKRLGCHTVLVTREKFKDAEWPRESIDEDFYMPTLENREHVLNAVSYLARTRDLTRIAPLDDFEGEIAAELREHLRLPGLGMSAIRNFRDKLAMRERTREAGINVPDFVGIINYDRIREFMRRVPPPWVLKPRGSAGAMGIKKIEREEELWQRLDALGDEQSHFLLEQFVPGDVFHVDSVVWEREIQFSIAHQYGAPPMSVSHGGGIFNTRTMRRDSAETQALLDLNRQVIPALGMVRGINHVEYIKAHADGKLYFLEAAARVGGANIAEVIEFAAGLNPWKEWARIEVAHERGEEYRLPPLREEYTGLLQCLAKQDYPDLSAYRDPEVVWHNRKKYHAGLIVRSPDPQRVESLLSQYSERFAHDFLAVLPY
ncbi:MAG: ATP-grasp domain-containing protein, partial [Chloroflexi bacterium]|nr:ATP-grasp domain-containing protein [Chloroflexota bacterium]